MKKTSLLFPALFLLGTGASMAQYKILHTFNGTAGGYPAGALTLSGSLLYGTTNGGGANGLGCIFSMDTNGSKYRDLFDFNGTFGQNPQGGALVVSGKKIYGTTQYGGIGTDSGCVYSIDTNGQGFKDLLQFNGTNGATTLGSVALSGYKLYGMTFNGGANLYGCIFSVDTSGGAYKDLYDFTYATGANPYGQVTILGHKFYGLAGDGGVNGYGNVFSLDTNGTAYTDLYDFSGPDGAYPNNILTPSVSGSELFGMTYNGGLNYYGNVFALDTNGSDFNDLVDFDSTSSPFGEYPIGDVILHRNMLLGMTSAGGLNDSGCIFSVDSNGSNYKDLFDFNGTNGAFPVSNLTISGNMLYGMAQVGGANHYGVIFSLKDTALSSGINKITMNTGVTLFPNPNNGEFTLQIKNYNPQIAGSNMEIYNMLGQLVYTSTITQSVSQLSLPAAVQGVYLYRIIDREGNIIGEGKFVVE